MLITFYKKIEYFMSKRNFVAENSTQNVRGSEM